MINLSEQEFLNLKEQNKAFPIFVQVNADELTPIGIFNNLKGERKFLLESVYSEKERGRYSFIGMEPYMAIRSYGTEVELVNFHQDGSRTESKVQGRVLDYVKEYMQCDYEAAKLPIPFTGGAIGYIGYDVIRQYERLIQVNQDELKLPEAYQMFYKTFVCYDHFTQNLLLVHNVLAKEEEEYKTIVAKLKNLEHMIKENNGTHELHRVTPSEDYHAYLTKEKFCEGVKQAKKYIVDGDIFQVVLSQRFKFRTRTQPFDIYRRLRTRNPSPYLFYIDFTDFQIIGSSPESLVTVMGDTVVTNPIAGTRVRGKNQQEDARLKEELLADPKERAEHVMLVDLGRNDIGKISEFGSVKLDKFMEVDLYSHVMHIVSVVSGQLRQGLTCFDALVSCLPVGTVSGAPKIRAMEIIDELEQDKRGVYAGAVGYFSYNRNMDTCIGIRTIVVKEQYAYVQAGAGIVYDSDPETEYIETMNKAMIMKEVI